MLLLSGFLGGREAILMAAVGGSPVQGTQPGLQLLVPGSLLSQAGWWQWGKERAGSQHLESQALPCRHGEPGEVLGEF